MSRQVLEILADAASKWRAWAYRDALPLWRDRGFSSTTGLFLERLHLDGKPDTESGSRVRTQARQIYTYAHAHLMGLDPEGLATARTALLTLRRCAWSPDGRPGWVHRLDVAGAVADDHRDLYDHAFVLLMLAYYLRASGEAFVRPWIDTTLAEMDVIFAAPHGGFAETDSGGAPRRQNPHMHLFEAMQALYAATGDERFLARAGELYGLFRTRFFDETHGVLREFFADDWSLLADGRSDDLEPGHLVEWVWLLRRYAALSGAVVAPLCARLLANGRRLGEQQPAPNFLADETDFAGEPRSDSRRLWSQTELIKALVVEARALGDVGLAEEARTLSDLLFATYLGDTTPGTWRDRFTLDGRLAVDHIPASTLYHLFGVLAELERSSAPERQ